jgi:integrase
VGRVAPGARRLHIAEAMSEVNGRAIFGSPKTHADRWVAVPRFMRDDVAVLMAGRSPDDLQFTSQRGEVLRVHGFRRRSFDRAATASGVPGLVPHELRHKAASLAIAAGANVKAVQIMLGHASAAMTLDRYSPPLRRRAGIRRRPARRGSLARCCAPLAPRGS